MGEIPYWLQTTNMLIKGLNRQGAKADGRADTIRRLLAEQKLMGETIDDLKKQLEYYEGYQ